MNKNRFINNLYGMPGNFIYPKPHTVLNHNAPRLAHTLAGVFIKRNIFHYFFLAFAFSIFTTIHCYAQQPVAYYSFDNTAIDKSGNNNNGTIHGIVTPAADRFGNPCGAMQFDGQTGFIEVHNSPSLQSQSTSITITVWYKIKSSIKDDKWLTAICKGTGSNELQNPQYRLQVQQTPGLLSKICNNADGASTISLNTEFTKCDNNFVQHRFETDKWCFYALVYDGTNVSAYMNEVKIFEQSYSGQLTANTSSLFIGIDEPGFTEYFYGAMDDLRIYRDALSDKEILNLFNEQRPAMFNQEEFEITVPPNKNLYVPATSCSTKVIFKEPVVKSLCNHVILNQTEGPLNGTSLGCGKYRISYSASSTSGYIQSCSFYVYIRDNIAPVLQVPGDTILYIPKGEKGIYYRYNTPAAYDNCKLKSVSQIAGNSSGMLFAPGKNKITYAAMDIYNNQTTKSFIVEVKEKPVVKPQRDTIAIVTPAQPAIPAQPVTPAQPVIPLPPAPKDTVTVFADTAVTPKERSFLQREILKTTTIEVDSTILQIELYDNAIIDGDSISLFFNKRVILENQGLGIKPIKVSIAIDTSIDNELSMYAENLGSIPPNTALMIVMDGKKRYEVFLSSTLNSCATIILRKKK